jgi:AraC-like DNA-binding protein
MHWSLSEFLQLLEVRSQCWCILDMGPDCGLHASASDAVFCYAIVEGSAKLCCDVDRSITLQAGDVAFVISGRAHALRPRTSSRVESLPFLDNDEYVDVPPVFSLGGGNRGTRVMCGRLKVRWPAGLNTSLMPTAAWVPAKKSIVNLDALTAAAASDGAAALLTRAAGMLFVAALRDHPRCQAIFHDASSRDPIARSLQFMQTHPFRPWTVATLATKVGMARSTFAARFLQKVGKSPMEVLTELRMRMAATLLIHSKLKVSEVAERVGYRSESAFNRRFVAHYNMTPGRMRERGAAEYEGGSEPLQIATERRRSDMNSGASAVGQDPISA